MSEEDLGLVSRVFSSAMDVANRFLDVRAEAFYVPKDNEADPRFDGLCFVFGFTYVFPRAIEETSYSRRRDYRV